MSDLTPRLGLPYLLPNQAQKHVTLNTSLQRLDTLAQLHVLSRSTYAQPEDPAPGDAYILNAGRTGEVWETLPENTLAVWEDGAWQAYTPRAGWHALILDEALFVHFGAGAWIATTAPPAENHLINGAFRLWQRGQTHTLPASSGTPVYTADRWALIQTAPAQGLTLSREASGMAQTPDALRMARPPAQAAAGEAYLIQALESQASASLIGQPVCAAIRARCGAGFAGRVATLEIIAGRGVDESAALLGASGWTGHQVIASAALTGIGSSFAQYFVSGAIPSDATQIGVRLRVTAPDEAPADDWLELAAAQLHAGFTPVAAPLRPIGLETLLAQRYFRAQGFDAGTAPAPGESAAQAFVSAVSGSAARLIVDMPVAMRRPPDVTFYRGAYASGDDARWNIRTGGSWLNATSTTLEVRTQTQLIMETAATVTEGLAYRINGGWTADAEL